MAITLTATESGSTSNSYVTLEEANTYLEAHMQASVWAELNDERKKAALISSNRTLETLKFSGIRSTKDQNLSWPRRYIIDYDGYQVTGVPKQLKSAQCELAMWYLTEEDRLASDFELGNLESVDMGPIKYKMKTGLEFEIIPEHIEELIERIGPNTLSSGNTAKVMVQ